MSDEKEKIEIRVRGGGKTFEFLEKRISELENRLNTLSDAIHRNYELIAELEKKYETIGIKIPETIHKYYDKNRTEIAELREFDKIHFRADRDYDLRYQRQLNELKDKVESLKDVEQSRDNIKEVLWELMNACKSKGVYISNSLFEKLEVGSARQTDYWTENELHPEKTEKKSEFRLKKGLKCSEGDSEKSIDGKTEKNQGGV